MTIQHETLSDVNSLFHSEHNNRGQGNFFGHRKELISASLSPSVSIYILYNSRLLCLLCCARVKNVLSAREYVAWPLSDAREFWSSQRVGLSQISLWCSRLGGGVARRS
jgi:hypothetical protein